MNDPAKIELILANYDATREQLQEFTGTIRRLLEDLVEPFHEEEVKRIHLVDARLKSRKSLKKKLEREERNDKSLSDITDLCGVRIITYYADDVDRVAEIVERELEIDWPNSVDKRDLLDPDRFGYLSLHYVAGLSPARSILAEYRPFAGLKAEIQVRSVFQHGWAEIEHGLGYRNKTLPGGFAGDFPCSLGFSRWQTLNSYQSEKNR